jgi:transposase
MSFAHRFSCSIADSGEDEVRAVALDVHRDFCEVAILAEGRLRSGGRIATRPDALELFAQSLDPRDRVALEVTGNAWAIARMLEPHVARVIVVSPSDTGIRQARAKTDRLDARALAKLLWAGQLWKVRRGAGDDESKRRLGPATWPVACCSCHEQANAHAEPIPWRCSRRLSGGSGRGVGVLHGGRERLGALLRRRRVHPHDLPAVAVEVEEAA